MNLGYADEYEAFVVDALTQETVAVLPWSRINWQRLRNDVSAASVGVSFADGGIDCCNSISSWFPWRLMLRIERNAAVVWDGPMTGLRREPNGDVVFRAMDRFVLMMKRLVGAYRFFNNAAPGAVIRQLITDASIGNPSFDPYTLTINGSTSETERITREYFVERGEKVFDAITEVCGATSTGFFSCVASNVYTYESDVRVAMGLGQTGTALKFDDLTTLGIPTVDIDGLNMSTRNYAFGSGTGVSGFPLIAVNAVYSGVFLSSLLEEGSTETRSGNIADLTLIAGRLAAENATPGFTLEKVQLAPAFGNLLMLPDLSNLIPGVQIDVDYFEESCAFNFPYIQYFESGGVASVSTSLDISTVRLDQLDVSVEATDNGISEVFEASCRPCVPGAS